MRPVEARYEDGLLKPSEPLPLRPGEQVGLIVLRRPDPVRWNLEKLAATDRNDDAALAEAGLSRWSDALDAEDRH